MTCLLRLGVGEPAFVEVAIACATGVVGVSKEDQQIVEKTSSLNDAAVCQKYH